MTAEQYTGTCEQETCPFWPGHGCACDLLDIDHEERRRAQRELGIDLEAAAADPAQDDLARPGRKPTRGEVVDAIASTRWQQQVDNGDLAGPWELEGWETPQMVAAHHELQARLRDHAAPFADAVINLYDRAAKGEL